jgi:nucleotide-binding universal stress UspA family protein
MPIRDLFCLLEATEKPSKATLAQALAIARGYGATSSILVAGPKAAAPYSLFSAGTVGEIVKTENERVSTRAEAVAAEARAELAKTGSTGNVEICLAFFQDILFEAKRRAICNDLTVMDRPGGVVERSEVLFEEMLFTACRPVFLPVPDRPPVEKIGKIVLAWDGSPYAARALSFALALFAGLKEADVVVVKGEKDLSNMVPAPEIAAHIERHGAKAQVVELDCDEDGVSSTIDSHAEKAGADLVVMGAFGRSRLREFVLGGVTRDLTRFSKRPLLLSH